MRAHQALYEQLYDATDDAGAKIHGVGEGLAGGGPHRVQASSTYWRSSFTVWKMMLVASALTHAS